VTFEVLTEELHLTLSEQIRGRVVSRVTWCFVEKMEA